MSKLNMKEWINEIIQKKEVVAMPIMTHPGIEMIGKTVRDAVTDKIIVEARKQAEVAAQKELDDVKKQIQQEKEEAIRDIRRQVAVLSVDIAEKVIRKNLDEEHEQMEMIDRMLDEVLAASRSN